MDRDEAIDIRPLGGYRTIYADPPWEYKNWSDKGAQHGASRHYNCMPTDDIARMRIDVIAAKNSILFLWVTDPMLLDGLRIMKDWGFEYKSVAFTWHKIKPSGAEHVGQGYYTRGNPEMCLMGTKGSVGRPENKKIRQYQQWPVREHSRKPDEIRDLIAEMYGAPRIELFSRQEFEGWDAWGNEVKKFEQGNSHYNVAEFQSMGGDTKQLLTWKGPIIATD